MAAALLDRLGRLGRFLWSGWAGLTGLALFAALWQAGHELYGDFILSAPAATVQAAALILTDPASLLLVVETVRRAAEGFLLAVACGAAGGLAAGYSAATMRVARPILTVLLGVPPIAWIVLAMIWFGSSDGTVTTTVVVAATPMIFLGVAEGVMSRDRKLDDMARAFGAGPVQRLRTLGLRHVSAYLFPVLTVALGTAFKVAVMAELLANTGGIGGALAMARANLDVTTALAWVLVAVGGLIAVEYLVVHPVRAEFERWREASRPWGVKR
ncbi:Hydroxymethylpyrimidine ABC transporter, transmembrane component [Caenispirillum salinarum AK4]|uniref:Hydroxymethylpyrimidine ABC transporter, transmembrane component n=1 Tax=Caenispirillum salinarum AK4 TaxID=1238182 RepID=K9GW13_9PROT|nr:ABC transporter permease subunit [Caenispirillum salinarum]EKV28959.1 Hydroxymethylpyrimidine ABC transporter, transmembrane component [Caenispirillum salinarum AK4]